MDGKTPMNAARLEELARKCERLDVPIDERIDSHDIRDLARCARFAAKVERGHRKCKGKWYFAPVCGCISLSCGYSTGYHTALEAVEEAAEVS